VKILVLSQQDVRRLLTMPECIELMAGTLATLAGTETLTNKTLTAPIIDQIVMDGTPDTDHTSVGPKTTTFAAGATITVMDLVVLNSSSKWVQTDANAVGTYAGMLAISLESKTDTQSMNVALPGSFVRDDTWAWTPGAVLYLSETAAQITATAPTTTDAATRVIGYAVTADVIWFGPSPDYITHV